MEQYNVTGMSCAACSARVEKAVSQVEGVTSCSVSLLTNSMGVEGSASHEAIIAELISLFTDLNSNNNAQLFFSTHDTSLLNLDLFRSVFLHGTYDVGIPSAVFF